MLKKLQNFLFLLLNFFLPTQLGKHFWPEWSLVNGLRIDYLSPTVYVTDLLIILLFVLNIGGKILSNTIKYYPILTNTNKKNKTQKSPSIRRAGKNPNIQIGKYCLIIGVFLYFSIRVFVPQFSPLSFIKLLKIIEIIVFVWIVKENLNKKNYGQFIFVLALSMSFQSVLATFQFFNHGSLNGIFYFFGERNFTSMTPGIANASINGSLILRPYGTLPHPNVLAGYLLLGMIIICGYFGESLRKNSKFETRNSKQIINSNFQILKQFNNLTIQQLYFISALFFSSLALFLTMSRVAIVLWIVLLITNYKLLITNFNLRIRMSIYLLIPIFLVIIFLFPRFSSLFTEDQESFVKRVDQTRIAIQMIKDHPIFGVGLNQYLVKLPTYLKNVSFRDYQPVHNSFLLILTEVGVVGVLPFFLLILKFSIFNFQFSMKNRNFKILKSKIENLDSISCIRLFLYSSILVLSLFDHYFWTTQQGNLMIGLIIGLTISNSKIQSSK